jgi:hypothetical protein
MARPRPPRTRLASFLRLLYIAPLWAVPFALFFALLNNGWRRLPADYLVSLAYAYANGLAAWAVGEFLDSRKARATTVIEGRGGRLALTSEIALYACAAVLLPGGAS